MSDTVKRLLVIEPYYGGSHKQFLDGLTDVVDAEVTLLSLPARKWKMRMQLSAPWFIEQLKTVEPEQRYFDVVLFSSFVDVAVFSAMSRTLEGWNPRCRTCLYFHENQFEYPGGLDTRPNHQFTAINFTSALTSDSIAFNSHYNRESFLSRCGGFLSKAGDMDLRPLTDVLRKKSRVLYPGIDFAGIDRQRGERRTRRIKRIVWNHRWEHDKDPDAFFDVLYRLADAGEAFQLLLLGQHFKNRPPCFEEAHRRLGDRIVHYGFVPDPDDYYRWLVEGDIVVSTALHEFFGISVLEAVRAGCIPLLPRRLAYPELFDERYLYDDRDLHERLRDLLRSDEQLPPQEGVRLTEPYHWRNLTEDYRVWLGL